jgi:hypothetical protein
VTFYFGFKAMPNLERIAEELPKTAWKKLVRPPKYEVQTQPRQRPANVKKRIVRKREFEVLRLQSEEVAEFAYQPVECQKSYRMVVVRKNISHEKGEVRLFDEIRHFFYISNDREASREEVVFEANERCDQENLIAQLSGGVRALSAPVDNRQVVRCDEYRPSRRSRAPSCPGSVQQSASRSIRSLYSAVNRRRTGFSETAGTGLYETLCQLAEIIDLMDSF